MVAAERRDARSMTDAGQPDDPRKRWWDAMKRAFDVPEGVSDENARMVIVGATIRDTGEFLCRTRPRRTKNGSLVPVGQGVIPLQMTGEHGGLVDQVGVEVLIAEAGLGRVQRRIGEVDA